MRSSIDFAFDGAGVANWPRAPRAIFTAMTAGVQKLRPRFVDTEWNVVKTA